ncbi:diphosphomevalonate decarboxylase [uncultured Limosilactobacillus sp.]|uniref:diphosphomevalonate decarboxylase n=1 Tax=uncultured Limosilactobacillus sp. TaxID=2837629 RepID=UPI0025DABF10|nr:diphosphomevalonate decarboxylase [uncultured Limosilactobacillus sp.]
MKASARAHTNIALVKYWGKKDQQLIIPQTDSLSLTLDKFYTDTTVEFNNHLKQDQLIIDGQPIATNKLSKVTRVLDQVRSLSQHPQFAKINSYNHVPMAAGLASSASAFAALALAASSAAGLHLSPRELSRLARRGSGSATRSIFGGLVQWHAGSDDASSYAEPIIEHVNFGIEMLAILIDTKQKKVPSRGGMQLSVTTSPFYPAWTKIVAQDMIAMKTAIQHHDIQQIGHIAEENAMRMHALTLSADPAFTYFNGGTIKAINLIKGLREQGLNCYYTMDAGPNVKVIYDRQDRQRIINQLAPVFGQDHLIVAQPGPGAHLI